MFYQTLVLELLPYDVKQSILDEIQSEKDLLQFALSSKGWCSLIIPNHLRYRSLRLDVDRPGIWSHLAQKAGLASRIRTVVLGPNFPGAFGATVDPVPFSPDICPEVEDPVHEKTDETRRSAPQDIQRAFANMTRLRTFQWLVRTDCEGLAPIHDAANAWHVFAGIQAAGSVKELYINDHDWRLFYPESADFKKADHPVSSRKSSSRLGSLTCF
jgi:hypothetical protein